MQLKTNKILFSVAFCIILFSCGKKIKIPQTSSRVKLNFIDTSLMVGAEQINLYLPLLKSKKVGLVVNHTSLINETHLADTLLKLNVEIIKNICTGAWI